MTYTTQQLQAMKDSEINVALELKLNKGAEFVGNHYVETGDGIYPNVIKHKNWPNYRECTDYCNNPNDIMPLAFERCISINTASSFDYDNGYFGEGKWVASESIAPCQGMTIDCSGLAFAHDNPLRAIACLLLMIDE